jgi:prepilin-type N-terminal cleavage/methylation domain-containing protein
MGLRDRQDGLKTIGLVAERNTQKPEDETKERKEMIRRILHREQGFTLVELLVTIAIMGVLFGIVTLALNGLTTNATTNTKAAELDQVQTAVDIYLAVNYPGTTTVTAQTASGPVTTGADFAGYMRSLPSQYSYTWDTDGNVAQQ